MSGWRLEKLAILSLVAPSEKYDTPVPGVVRFDPTSGHLFSFIYNSRADHGTLFFNDKLNHILALATLSFLWDYASFHSKINILVKVAPLLLIALILEVLQLATTTRVFELTDIVAGAFGIGIYWTLQFLSRRKLDQLLEKLIG